MDNDTRRNAIAEALGVDETIAPIATDTQAQETKPEALETSVQSKEIQNKTNETVIKAEKQREPSGKFAKVEKQEEITNAQVAAEIEKILAPKSLKKELADKHWGKLDPEFQKALVQREQDSEKGFEAIKTHTNLGKEFEAAAAPYMATINKMGVSAAKAAQHLFNADHILRYGNEHEKVRMAQQIFNDYGINPQSVFNAYQPQQEIDPSLAPLYNELQSLRGQLSTTQQQQQMREEESLRIAQQNAQSEIESQKANMPHFDIVREDMADLMEAGKATTLEEAYQKATRMNPELFDALIKSEIEKVRGSASQAELAKRQQAASSSVKGSSPALGGAKPLSRRELIAQNLNS